MFKIEDMPKSIYSNNNNPETYIYHPRNRLSKTLHGSFSGLISSRDNTKRSFENRIFNENTKLNLKEDTYYKLNRVPRVYFYRKISTPYKYNMLSVPEYLIKTDEEKHFMEKLNLLISNESDRKTLNNLVIKKEKERKFKDRYKPSILNVQNILRYRPNLYSNSFLFEKRSNSVIMKDIKDNSFFNNNNNNSAIHDNNNNINNNKIDEKIDKEKESEENDNNNINNNINNELKEDKNEKKEENENKEKRDEISEEDQIKYKYKISDIYNIRNEKVITDKSAEKYLFKNYDNKNIQKINNTNNENNFFTTSKSKSDWIPNRTIGTKMNSFSSVSYNIISPLYKGFNKFISPSELNKNNLYNESTAFHRVKSISEFIDLTRVSASNTLNCFNRKNKIPNFKLRNMVATDQLDEYKINKDLIEKPI